MPVSALPNLDHLYAKWENRGPKAPGCLGSAPVQNGVTIQNGKDIRGGDEGRKRWTERFGKKVQPLRHRRARDKSKFLALSAETVSINVTCE